MADHLKRTAAEASHRVWSRVGQRLSPGMQCDPVMRVGLAWPVESDHLRAFLSTADSGAPPVPTSLKRRLLYRHRANQVGAPVRGACRGRPW